MGATMAVMITSGRAVRQSTMPARAKVIAPAMAVRPLSHSDQGMMTCLRS